MFFVLTRQPRRSKPGHTVTDILKDLTVNEAAQLLQIETADIVEVQHFRTDHVRIRFREEAAVRAAYEAMKSD